LPGAEGILEILSHHAALITTLTKGSIRVRDSAGEVQQFEIENGVVECANNRVVVLL
jgi:F-type H+-transporting ATPase subunit epsilon